MIELFIIIMVHKYKNLAVLHRHNPVTVLSYLSWQLKNKRRSNRRKFLDIAVMYYVYNAFANALNFGLYFPQILYRRICVCVGSL